MQQSVSFSPVEHYPALDILRGVAAVAVVCAHVGLLARGYLAVDFFFILSGFVIAHAYEQRLSSGLSRGAFAIRRWVRLYPMILLGVVAGAIASASLAGPPVGLLARATLAGLLLAPLDGMGQVGFGLWPVNPPSWSLAWELVANAAYALILFRLRTPWLVLIAAAGGVGLLLCAVMFGTLEVGFLPEHFWGGAARVAFAFPAGVILFRLSARLSKGPNVWLLAAILLAVLAMPAGQSRAAFDLVAAMVVLPLLVAAAIRSPAPAAVANLLGRLSYPLYIVHTPILLAGKRLAQVLALDVAGRTMLAVATVLVSILVAYVVLKLYDEPVRARLATWIKGGREPLPKPEPFAASAT